MTLMITEPAMQRMPVERPTESPRADCTDGQLLRCFLTHRQEAARTQEAFAHIVRRHGPMVLRTCQRIVGQAHDADDAFQATFMVLVKKAGTIQPPDMLAPWLHGVACRCATALKHKLYRLQQREVTLTVNPAEDAGVEPNDWQPFLDHEIQQLPELYRRPVVLCELQGLARKEAAELLGIAEGTLSSRLASARKRLAEKLAKRGLLSVAVLSSWVALQPSVAAAVPESLVNSTIALGMKLIHHPATVGLAANLSPADLPPTVASLTQGALQSMFITKCKTFALVAAGIGCLGYGCWFIGDVGATEASPVTISQTRTLDDQQPYDPSMDDTAQKQGQHQGHASGHSGQHAGQPHNSKHETMTGSGSIKTETRTVANFHSIILQNAGKLIIKQTGKEKLTVTTDDNLLTVLSTESDQGKLVLKNTKQVNLKPSKDISYVIEVKSLDHLEINGAGSIVFENIDVPQLVITVSGSASVKLQGKTIKLGLTLSGSASIDASALNTVAAAATIPGTGSVIVNANEVLQATIQGTGSIQYTGDPKITRKITGTGSIKKYEPREKKE